MPDNLLTTKFYTPLPHPDLVSRERLINRLESSWRQKLVLISAPAGFGKTTLLGEWAQGMRKPLSWLSLDESDNDPARFLAYLVTALQKIDLRIGKEVLEMLRNSQPPLSEMILTSLINDIAQTPNHFFLILDDYHLIQVESIHKAIAFMLEHLPMQMHLMIATRIDPPLPLARLRAANQLTEIRLSDLRFSLSEAISFFKQTAELELTTEEITALAYRTEGWVAGLQMAAIALQARKSWIDESSWVQEGRAEFIKNFMGSNRYVMDYLIEEVLNHQPDSLQKFLLRTSILNRLTGSLCEYVAGSEQDSTEPVESGQETLDALERSNLFVVPMDDGRSWYRYHRLFVDLLRNRLQQLQPELIPVLHQRASEWFEQQSYTSAAIDHAIAARDFERAARLLDDIAEATLMRSQVETLQNWITALPTEVLLTRPNLRLYQACAMLLSGHSMETVEACLQGLDETDDLMAVRLKALRSFFYFYQGNISLAAELAHQAIEKLPEDDFFLQNIISWNQTYSPLESDDFGAMMQELETVAQIGQNAGNMIASVGAISTLARIQKMFGRLDEAAQSYQRALEIAKDSKGELLPIAGSVFGGLGELMRERNDLDNALKYLEKGIALSQPIRMYLIDTFISLMMVKLARRDFEGAQKVIWEAKKITSNIDLYQADMYNLDAYQARLWIEQGDMEACRRWATERGLSSSTVLEELDRSIDASAYSRRQERRWSEYTTLARLLIASGESNDALALLDRLLNRANRLNLTDRVISTQVLRALALQSLDDIPEALDALEQALTLAELQGYVRVFLDEGEPIAYLLALASSRNRGLKYTSHLLRGINFPESSINSPTVSSFDHSLIERLSDRELEVLKLLRTNLSAPEIAEELFIAVSTVRSHIKNIYGKLGVHRRREAVERAKNLGLL